MNNINYKKNIYKINNNIFDINTFNYMTNNNICYMNTFNYNKNNNIYSRNNYI